MIDTEQYPSLVAKEPTKAIALYDADNNVLKIDAARPEGIQAEHFLVKSADKAVQLKGLLSMPF